jgi:hypothetical protein
MDVSGQILDAGVWSANRKFRVQVGCKGCGRSGLLGEIDGEDGRDRSVSYLEAAGRLLAGMAGGGCAINRNRTRDVSETYTTKSKASVKY